MITNVQSHKPVVPWNVTDDDRSQTTQDKRGEPPVLHTNGGFLQDPVGRVGVRERPVEREAASISQKRPARKLSDGDKLYQRRAGHAILIDGSQFQEQPLTRNERAELRDHF